MVRHVRWLRLTFDLLNDFTQKLDKFFLLPSGFFTTEQRLQLTLDLVNIWMFLLPEFFNQSVDSGLILVNIYRISCCHVLTII